MPAASPASLMNSGEHTPSPASSVDLMPSCVICLAIGPAVASMPPYMTTSGLAPRTLVRIALKSVALSFVNSRATTFTPFSLATFSTTSARPCP